MKTKHYTIAGLVLFAAVLTWHFRPETRPQKPRDALPPSSSPQAAPAGGEQKPVKQTFYDPTNPASRLGPYAGMSVAELWRHKPAMFQLREYPPTTPEGAALWQWRNAMRKADPKFEHKTPIEFYGKVVDQSDAPIVGAEVALNWAALSGEPAKKTVFTGADGAFTLSGVQGKVLSVFVSKNGYVSGKASRGGFEYAAFFEPDYHVPKPSNPVIFRLWKLGSPEPMYLWNLTADLTVDGTPHHFNASTGRKDGNDLIITVIRSNEAALNQFDYTLKLQTGPGGGLARSVDDLMFIAPADGYVPSITITMKHGAPDYSIEHKLRYYLKTPEGKYAAFTGHIAQHSVPNAQVQMVIYFNPSGSRNLEYDYKLRINR